MAFEELTAELTKWGKHEAIKAGLTAGPIRDPLEHARGVTITRNVKRLCFALEDSGAALFDYYTTEKSYRETGKRFGIDERAAECLVGMGHAWLYAALERSAVRIENSEEISKVLKTAIDKAPIKELEAAAYYIGRVKSYRSMLRGEAVRWLYEWAAWKTSKRPAIGGVSSCVMAELNMLKTGTGKMTLSEAEIIAAMPKETALQSPASALSVHRSGITKRVHATETRPAKHSRIPAALAYSENYISHLDNEIVARFDADRQKRIIGYFFHRQYSLADKAKMFGYKAPSMLDAREAAIDFVAELFAKELVN